MPAVSVIIPVFSVEPYIERCARSLFLQTMEDIEFVFVDDCSPDRSVEIIQSTLEDYPNRKNQVKIVRLPKNGGLPSARLVGVAMATGDYLTHCDSDDVVYPDAYRLMYEKAISEDLDIVTCDYYAHWDNGRVKRKHQGSVPGREVADIMVGTVWATVWSRLYNKSLWENMLMPKGTMWEDVVFTIQAICKATRFGHVDVPLYDYYVRESSISCMPGKQKALQRWMDVVNNATICLDYLANWPNIQYTKEDLLYFKYSCRSPLMEYTQNLDIYRKWRQTFPEIDRHLLFSNAITAKEKFWFILLFVRLYYPWKKLTRGIRRFVRGH